MPQLLHGALGHHLAAVGPGLRAHLQYPVRLPQNLGVVVHQQHGVSIGHQILHHPGEPHNVRGVQPYGGLVQHVEHPGGAVAHRSSQLHPLALPGGQGRGGPIQAEVPQPQLQQPPGHRLEGLADALRHGAHLLGQGARHGFYPLYQLGKGHGAGLVQGDAPQLGGPGCLAETGAVAVGAGALHQELLHPLHALFVLHLGEGVLHRVDGVEIGEVQLAHLAGALVVVQDVLFHRRPVVDNVLFLLRQLPEGHVGAHAHLPAHVHHQRPHQGVPRGHGALLDGQGLVGHQGIQVHPPHNAGAPAGAASPLGVKGQLLRPRRVEGGAALRAGDGLFRRHRQGRGDGVPVGAAVAGQPGEHQPQGV